MNISIDKYRFYTSKNCVYAVSTYAGKPVRGVAKCDPVDEFSLNDGKELAMARCCEKIAEKRLKRAKRKLVEAQNDYITSKQYYERMKEYFYDSEDALAASHKNVEDILNKLAP